MFSTILALFLSLGPILFYLSIALFSRNFLTASDVEKSDSGTQKKTASRKLCTSPGCVRCNRNKQEINAAISRFQNGGYPSSAFDRIERALIQSTSDSSQLFFKLDMDQENPIWSPEQLPQEFVQKLALLEQNHGIIMEECEKALQFGHLWHRNDEPQNGSCWFTFSLINQGTWMEQQCQECPQLTSLLHKLDSGDAGYLLTDCLFGNVFLSMLPANSAIAEHRGLTNARLRVHFGLEVPKERADKCFMLVAGHKFHWSTGKSVVIDDSFPHSVSSLGSPQDRIVLVLDFWHPHLSGKERECLRHILPSTSFI